MAIGDVISKRIFQGALSTTVTALYTAPANKQTQIVEIWVDNQNTTTARKVDLYAHGTALTNRLAHNIPVAADYYQCLENNKIVLAAGEVLGMKQDSGTDCVVTLYGIEEVVS